MRFALHRTPDEQSILLLHTLRRHAITARVSNGNTLHAILAELGYVAESTDDLMERATEILSNAANGIPPRLKTALRRLVVDWKCGLDDLEELDREIAAWARQDRVVKLLLTIPGVGPQSATVAAATMGDPNNFESGISVRRLRRIGTNPFWDRGSGWYQANSAARDIPAIAALPGCGRRDHRAKEKKFVDNPWLGQLLARKPRKLACIAQASKTARIIWSVARSGAPFERRLPASTRLSRETRFLIKQRDTWFGEGGRCDEVE